MKKLVYSFLFALILPLLVFTGCGGTPKSKATFYVDGSLYTTIEFEQQKSFDLPHAPEKDGYYQIGWESNGMIFGLDAPYYGGMSNVSFYAVYKPTALKITHNNIDGIQVDNFGTSFNITLADGIETFDLAQVLNMSPEATWDIPNDNNNYCQISGTTVTLYQSSTYISITGSYLGDTVEYHINIMNYSILPRYALTFNGVDDPVYVRQGQTINPEDIPELPEHYDEDYIAASWDFDFSTPIYSDQYINYVIDQKYKHVEYYVDGELVHTSEELAYGDTATLYDRFQFTKTHYHTELWNTKPDFSGSTVGYDFNFDADYHALYLEFRPITYTVYIQNTAGATKEDGDVFYALYYTIESSTSDLTLPEISKNYNNFVGYQDSEGNYYNVFPIEKIGELDELTAVWDPIKYNITYVLNGGTNNNQNPDYVVCDTHYEFVAPTKDCYEFAGWHTTPECNDSKPTTTMYTAVPEEKTFYAKWNMINYQVRYIINHDEYLQNQDELVSTISINNHTVIATEQTGFTFNYFADNENNNITTEKDGIISVNTSYMAKTTYDKNYEAYVIFLKTNATPIQYPITYLSDKPVGNNPNKTTYTILEAVSLAEPTSTGYEFVKFTYNGTKTTGFEKGQTGPKSIYIDWDIINYDLSFVSLDKGIYYSMQGQYDTYNIESDFEFSDAIYPSSKGYCFDAFYEDSEKTTAITGITPGSTGDKTVYIDFDIATYTVTYQNVQGGIRYKNGEFINESLSFTYTYFDETNPTIDYLYKEFNPLSHYNVLSELIVYDEPKTTLYAGEYIREYACDIVLEPVYKALFRINEEGYITLLNTDDTFNAINEQLPESNSYTFPSAINSKQILGVAGPLDDFVLKAKTLIFPEGYTTLDGIILTTASTVELPSTLTTLSGSTFCSTVAGEQFGWANNCPNLTTCDISHTRLTSWNSYLPASVTQIVLPNTLTTFDDNIVRNYTFPQGLAKLNFGESDMQNTATLDLSMLTNLTTCNIRGGISHLKVNPHAPISSYITLPGEAKLEVIGAETLTSPTYYVDAAEIVVGNNIDIAISRESCSSLILGNGCNISFGVSGVYIASTEPITSLTFGEGCKIVGVLNMNYINLTTFPTKKLAISKKVTSLTQMEGIDNFGDIFEFEDISTITTLGEGVFSNTTGINFTNDLTGISEIPASAFSQASFEDGIAIFPNNITRLGASAFSGVVANKIVIPPSVETHGQTPFYLSRIQEVHAPKMTSDYGVLFTYATEIKTFVLQEGSTSLPSLHSTTETVYLPQTLTTLSISSSSVKNIYITDTEENPSQLKVVSHVNCENLIEITLPDCVETIGNFKGCKLLKTFVLPASTTTLGQSAFENCSALESVTLNSHVIALEPSAFKNCTSLTTVNGIENIKSFDTQAFYGCSKLQNITFGDAVTNISSYAFYGCALTEVILPNSLKTLGNYVFANNATLEFVYLPKTVTTVGEYIVADCSESIVLATNLTESDTRPSDWNVRYNFKSPTAAGTITPTFNYDISQRQSA